MSAYAELAVTTNFSFLRGASHPQEMVARADELGLAAIGIADRNSFAGVVRAYDEARKRNIKLLVGTRLVTGDGFEVLAYPTDRAAYGRLCRLITAGNLKAKKGECELDLRADSHRQRRPDIYRYPPNVSRAQRSTAMEWCAATGSSRRRVSSRRDASTCSVGNDSFTPPRRLAAPRRPHLPRRRALSSRRRAAPARAFGRTRRPARRAARRRQRCFLSRRRNAGRSPTCSLACAKNARLPKRACGLPSMPNGISNRHAEMARLFAKFSRRHRPHRRDRASLPLLARRTQIRISRRAGAGRQDRTSSILKT